MTVIYYMSIDRADKTVLVATTDLPTQVGRHSCTRSTLAIHCGMPQPCPASQPMPWTAAHDFANCQILQKSGPVCGCESIKTCDCDEIRTATGDRASRRVPAPEFPQATGVGARLPASFGKGLPAWSRSSTARTSSWTGSLPGARAPRPRAIRAPRCSSCS